MQRVILYLAVLIFSCFYKLHAAIHQDLLEKSQKPVVSIKKRAVHAAYTDPSTTYGTGFIIDAKKGIIVTNAHVAGIDQVSTYEVTYFDGRQSKAKLLYVDPHHDFAFLRVDPSSLPADLPHIEVNPKVILGGPIFIIGKNENKNFSMQTGTIASPYETTGILTQQVFRISLNAQGGASGSPVFDREGRIVGIIHASNNVTSAFALPFSYIQDALDYLQKDQKPPRLFSGVVLEYISLDEAVRFFGYPSNKIESYLKKYPDSFNKILRIGGILPGTNAEKIFQVGDIILSVNNVEIGPQLYLFSKLCNQAPDGKVLIKIFRSGKEIDLDVPLEDLYLKAIHKLVHFGGAIFYESDDFVARRSGNSVRKVFISNIRPGSSFFEKLPLFPNTTKAMVGVEQIDGIQINQLADLIKIIPQLIKKQDFSIVYRNYGVDLGYDNTPLFSQMPQVQEITFNEFDGIPEVFEFDFKEGLWKVKQIVG